VTLAASAVELVAAKPTRSPTPAATNIPCNAGNGNGSATGRCPTPSPSGTPCPGSCKPLLGDSMTGPILTASGMKPGDTARGSVVITANGNVYVSLFEDSVTHTGPAGSGNLAHRLALTITDQTGGTQLYTGPLDSMPSTIPVCGSGPPPNQTCPRWANDEAHTFLFVLTFPNAGNNGDNSFQSTGASAEFVWGATR
jgi:hypothetical protein